MAKLTIEDSLIVGVEVCDLVLTQTESTNFQQKWALSKYPFYLMVEVCPGAWDFPSLSRGYVFRGQSIGDSSVRPSYDQCLFQTENQAVEIEEALQSTCDQLEAYVRRALRDMQEWLAWAAQ